MGHTEYSTEKKNLVVQFILGKCVNGKPPRGTIKEAHQKFGMSRQTISRYWNAAKHQQNTGNAIQLVNRKKVKHAKIIQFDVTLLKSLHFSKRSNIRSLAVGLGCSKSTVGRWVKAGLIRSHTSAIRPDLTAPNKLLRLTFTLEAIELDRMLNKILFRNMQNTVHIDEKWFYITQGSQRYYLAPEEDEPHRTCKNKNYISKIMFMCAVTRPLFSDNGEVLFDGKIGIFPFTEQVPAKRNSKNRCAGTLETKPIASITKEVTKQCLINKIIPAIMEKWPEGRSKFITIQQDNAKPHIANHDPDFRAAATQNGFNIQIVQQPPNSPDTNVNDLGWFRAIQSLQLQTTCNTLDDLVKAVEKSFHDLCPVTLDNVFLSLQSCMLEIMKVKGKNCYKIPHIGKASLRRSGQLPDNLQVPLELVNECISYLQAEGCNEGLDTIIRAIGM